MYGVIDIGSNTVRFVIYQAEGGKIKAVLNKKTSAGLVGYVNKENRLNQKGIERAVEILSEYREVADSIQLDGVYVFATAIFRNIDNRDEVLRVIKEKCGFDVKVLTGHEEANFGYEGTVKSTRLESGILADIGGGSTELVFYKDGKAVHSCSMPIGSLNLYTRYVKSILPKKRELGNIKVAVRDQLAQLDPQPIDFVPHTLCAVGGTARTAYKLIQKRTNEKNVRSYPCQKIKEMIGFSINNTREFTSVLLKVAPERIHTIIPGMIIMQEIAGYYNLETVITSAYGVREGFLYSILKEATTNA